LLDLGTIDGGWDVLYTDPYEKSQPWSNGEESNLVSRPDVNLNFLKPDVDESSMFNITDKTLIIFNRTRASSIIISRKGMKRVLSYYHKHHFFIPFSVELPLIPGLRAYATKDPIVSGSSWVQKGQKVLRVRDRLFGQILFQ
jgi:hypothetical protein